MAHTNKDPASGAGGALWGGSGKNESPLNSQDKQLPQARSSRHAAIIETLLILRAKYPQCFARLDRPRRQPLKVGIHSDIAAAMPELTPAEIGRALSVYVNGGAYLQRCIEGAARIDLDGQPAGTVTAKEALYASDLLGRRTRKGSPAPSPKLSPDDLKAAARKRAVTAP